jgi:hypothetical protein
MDRLGGEGKSLAGRGLIPQGTSEAQRLITGGIGVLRLAWFSWGLGHIERTIH